MIEILKTLELQEVERTHPLENYKYTSLEYICPEFKEDEYLALTVNGKLSHPTGQNPYITRNTNSYLFNPLKYDKKNKHYKMVLVKVDYKNLYSELTI